MHCRHDPRRQLELKQPAALACDAKGRAEKRLRRGRAEANEHAWPNNAQFRFQPGTAGGDIARAWFLVDTPFATRLPFEVLDSVGDIDRVAIDPRFFESAIQDLTRRADEGFTAQVFLVARLLADEHKVGVFATFTENRLGRPFVKRTGRALRRSFA
jgi:hypothetical protein